LFTTAFWLGATAVLWVGAGFIGSHILALVMTALIGAVYVFGAFELRQFRQASTTLAAALEAVPNTLSNLEDWLGSVHPSLQNAVRLRIEGERTGLPGPALTPYLVGLLVMLGMLGTFLGMVVTLNGAAFSLESTTDLQAIRAALAAPIKGLGLAFGTSVAGVAASSMLGLMSALSRRERMLASLALDTQIATRLRPFSLTHQRQETYKALQFQAHALPEVVNKLNAMMVQMTHMSQQLNGRMLSNQDNFHSEVKSIYTNLATSVDKSLKDSLTQSAQVASDSIKPVIEAAMAGIAKESSVMHARVMDATQMQLDGLAKRFNDTSTTVSTTWTTALATHQDSSAKLLQGLSQRLNGFTQHFEQRANLLLAATNEAHVALRTDQAALDQQQQTAWKNSLQTLASTLQHEWQQTGAQTRSQQQEICAILTQTAQHITTQAQISASTTLAEVSHLMATSEELIRTRVAAEADWTTQHSERMTQVTNLLRDELGALRVQEAAHGQAAVDRLGDLQTALASHLSTLGSALEAPITRLLDTASQAPRAAAEVIGQLRLEMSNNMVRDNALLDERSRILATLNTLLEGIHHAAAEQRTVIDTLVNASAVTLNQAGSQFAEQVGLETVKLSDIAAQVTSSAVEVSSLGESFGFAVHTFTQSNEKLMGSLQRIEAAMDKSMGRSDEQLAYYVAQAREIIDLSILSQKEIFEALRQLPGKPVAATGEVA
jgi:hypothetical protein